MSSGLEREHVWTSECSRPVKTRIFLQFMRVREEGAPRFLLQLAVCQRYIATSQGLAVA